MEKKEVGGKKNEEMLDVDQILAMYAGGAETKEKIPAKPSLSAIDKIDETILFLEAKLFNPDP